MSDMTPQTENVSDWKQDTSLLSCLQEGVIIVDSSGYVRMVNPSALGIFGSDETHPEGKLASQIFHHPDLLALFNMNKSYPQRTEITLEDGRVFSAQASLVPDGRIVVVLQEITHLKELDRIKSDFVNTVSHDIRSPLTSIYGFVGLIDKVGPVNEQQADFIQHIQTSVQHITALINDLMELGRVEAHYDLQMKEVNLGEIVQLSMAELDYQAGEKMLEVVVTLQEVLPVIQGNALHLQRMVTNLVDNAIKFTPALGKVSVACRTEGNQVILEVKDTGAGIPLADQPHIFDRFYRGSNLSESTPGTGLGLAIVKSIVERHHGRIWMESSASGTTFSVILPI